MHLLVDHFLEVPQLLLHAVRQGGVVEAQAEFDVALLGAEAYSEGVFEDVE